MNCRLRSLKQKVYSSRSRVHHIGLIGLLTQNPTYSYGSVNARSSAAFQSLQHPHLRVCGSYVNIQLSMYYVDLILFSRQAFRPIGLPGFEPGSLRGSGVSPHTWRTHNIWIFILNPFGIISTHVENTLKDH